MKDRAKISAKKLTRKIKANKRREKLLQLVSPLMSPKSISEFLNKPWEELGNRTPNQMLKKSRDFKKLVDFSRQYIQALLDSCETKK